MHPSGQTNDTQAGGNGNLSRTTTLLREYQACRAALSGKSDAASRLFRTHIDIPDPFVWNIFADQNMTLGKYVNHELTRKNDPGLWRPSDESTV